MTKNTIEQIRIKLLDVITRHDAKEATRKGYNRNGLAIMITALDAAIDAMVDGMEPADAIHSYFNGNLRCKLIHALQSLSV